MPKLALSSDVPHAIRRPRPRRSALRQFGMGVLLCLLTAVIWGYWTLTDSRRVKDMAETYLSRILGGQVRVAKANLSLFEGLRLEGVSVAVDDQQRADSRIFTARTFIVKTTPRALISGRLESTQILAIDPKVHLCEDLDTHRWNFERIRRPKQERKEPRKKDKSSPVSLPEVLLRGGVVEISKIERGRHVVVGNLAIDGQLMPAGYDLNRYSFDLESRLPGQPVGPRLQGLLDLDRGSVKASLDGLEFSEGILGLMPAQVRTWWEAHQIAGRVRIPEFQFSPGGKDEPADFRIALEVDRVRMSVLPEELMGQKEYRRQTRMIAMAPQVETNLRYWGTTDLMQRLLPPRPVRLKGVSGRILFTPSEISLIHLHGNLEGNRLLIDGVAEGYDVDAPGRMRVIGTSLDIPHVPRYLASLPRPVRKFYGELRPSGVGKLLVDVERKRPKGPVDVTVELIVTKGSFAFHEFRYPLHDVTGSVWFGKDKETGLDRVEMRNIRGKGALGTANENKELRLDGWVSPLNRHVGLNLLVRSEDCHLDPELRAAMPREAQQVVEMFDELDEHGNVTRPAGMHGRFETRITRTRGPGNRLNVEVDIDIDKGTGAFEPFAYPLRNLSAKVRIRPNYVELIDVVERQADARLELEGRVNFGNSQPVDPQLKIRAYNVPIDDRLLNAMPEQQREWLRKVALRGRLNVNGRIFLEKLAGDWTVNPLRDPLLLTSSEVGFDLNMSLADGRMWRVGDLDAITDVSAEARLTRTRLELKEARGKRGDADLTGSGSVAWPKDSPSYSLNVDVLGLRVDDELRTILGAKAADLFAELRPEGQTDLSIAYSGGIAEDDDPAGNRDPWQTYKVTVRPRGMSVEPSAFRWRIDKIFGEVEATPQRIEFKGLSGWHEQSKVTLSGFGPGKDQKGWALKLSAADVVVDDAFRRSLPDQLAELAKTMEYSGKLSLDLPTLTYQPPAPGSPDAKSMLEFAGRVNFIDASMDVGVPLSQANGGVDLKGSVVGGELASLSGRVDLASTLIAQREAQDVRVDILKFPSGWYRFDNLEAKFGGGNLSGAVHLHAPAGGPTRVGMALVLKDVDVRELTGDKDDKLHGRLRGSLNLEMTPSNPTLRRGRGDVELEGRELYKVPAMTGLLQITNLALPSPFNSASASYVVDGNKLTFENIAIRAKDMVMNGSGSVDFGTKAVSLTFVTDNPNWPKIPLLKEIKNQLIQIQIRGTVQEPKVAAKSMTVITTTVDEVLSDGKKDAGGGRKKR